MKVGDTYMIKDSRQFRVYVAGPWLDRHLAVEAAAKLREKGFVVENRWHTLDAPENPSLEFLRQNALDDLEDLTNSFAMLYINSRKSEGKATELGYAIATLKPIIIVGNREGNIFLNLDMPCFPHVDLAVAYMSSEDILTFPWRTKLLSF